MKQESKRKVPKAPRSVLAWSRPGIEPIRWPEIYDFTSPLFFAEVNPLAQRPDLASLALEDQDPGE